MPSNAQAQTCLWICQLFPNCYRDIQIFRFDPQTKVVFIFAGEELQILVNAQGQWRFLDAIEL